MKAKVKTVEVANAIILDRKRNPPPPPDQELYLSPPETNRLVLYNIALSIVLSALLTFFIVQQLLIPLATILLAVLSAGTLGATLCNLRGLFSNLRDKNGKFPARLAVPYYVRPLAGMLTGFMSFFVGSLLVTSLSVDAASGDWSTLTGQIPYIAIAILSGFAAQEFMERLKATASTLFSERNQKDLYGELEKLATLYEKKVLDEDEFKAQKALLLREHT